MKITTFAKKVSRLEGKNEQISIAQISEILSICNKITGGLFYTIIRWLP